MGIQLDSLSLDLLPLVPLPLDPLSLDLLPLDPFSLDQLSSDEFLLVYLCICDVVGSRGHKIITKNVVYMVKNIIQCRKGRMSRMSTDNGRKFEDRVNSQFISSQYSLKKLESHPILSICSRLLVAIWLLWNPERNWIVWSRTWTTSSTTLKPSASTPWAWRVRQRRTLASSSGRAKVLVSATGMLPRPCGQTGKDSANDNSMQAKAMLFYGDGHHYDVN